MVQFPLAATPDINETTVRDQLADKLWQGMLVLAVVGIPLSLARIAVTGWQPLYGVHTATAVIIFLIALFRRHLSTDMKAFMTCVLPLGIGLPALQALGFYGAGIAWVIASCISATMFFKGRVGAIVIALELLVMAGYAWAFVSGALVLSIDTDDFVRQPQAWVAVIGATGIVTAALCYGMNVYSTTHTALMHTIHEQNRLIAHQASHDGLTGLPMPHLARDRLGYAIEVARRNKGRAALLFIDLDAFKSVNDTHGHDAGDFVLTTVAQRMLANIRAVDSASRQGGDEFMVALGGLESVEDAATVAHKLVEVIALPMEYQGKTLQVGASIGIAVYPDHADSAETMMKQADIAMYRAKKAGKNTYAIATA